MEWLDQLTLRLACLVLISGYITTRTHAQVTSSDGYSAVIAVKHLHLQEGVDPDEARTFLETDFLEIYTELPGFNAQVGLPDPTRMDDSGPDFVLIYSFDSKWTRDYYFPEPDQWSDAVHRAIQKNQVAYDKLFNTYFKQDAYENHEYIVFARAK